MNKMFIVEMTKNLIHYEYSGKEYEKYFHSYCSFGKFVTYIHDKYYEEDLQVGNNFDMYNMVEYVILGLEHYIEAVQSDRCTPLKEIKEEEFCNVVNFINTILEYKIAMR